MSSTAHKNLDEQAVINTVEQMVENQETLEEMKKMVKPLTLSDVAKEFKVTRQAIHYILNKNNLSVWGMKKNRETNA
jgi:Zn-dependent peptidase ImmA (M78 family)